MDAEVLNPNRKTPFNLFSYGKRGGEPVVRARKYESIEIKVKVKIKIKTKVVYTKLFKKKTKPFPIKYIMLITAILCMESVRHPRKIIAVTGILLGSIVCYRGNCECLW